MIVASRRRRKTRNRIAQQLHLEHLESRQLLAVVLGLPTEPIQATEGTELDVALVQSSSGTLSLTTNPVLDGATIDAAGHLHWTPPDGPATINVEVTVTDADGAAGAATGNITINVANVAPEAGISGPTSAVPGLPLSFTLTATDPSVDDTAAGFDFTVDWGDGSPIEQFSDVASGQIAEHTFAATGPISVTVTAADKDGDSDVATLAVSVTPTAVITDPVFGGTMLAIGGTAGNDQIVVNPSRGLKVILNGSPQGNFSATSRVVVFGLEGNDNIQIAGAVRLPVWLYGGPGDDRLKGAKGNDFLFGEEGNDSLNGQQGNDLLVGGLGLDDLNGGPNDDVLVGGTINADLADDELKNIMTTWAQTAKTPENAEALKTSLGVIDDADADRLVGASGVDVFFYQVGVDSANDVDLLKASKPKHTPKPKKK